MLAETGRRSTNQALQRADVDRRHPILLATLAETYVEVLENWCSCSIKRWPVRTRVPAMNCFSGWWTVPERRSSVAGCSRRCSTSSPTRWRGYLDTTHGQGRGAAYRHYWELSVLYGVQPRLRSGDVWVPGSRRYTDPTTLLIPVETWAAQRDDFCTVTGTDPDPVRQSQRLEAALHVAVSDLERVLADPGTEGLARLNEDGELIVSPLPAEQVPAEAEALADAVAARLRVADLIKRPLSLCFNLGDIRLWCN